MGFVRVENYDGTKGYVPGNIEPFVVTEMKGVKYLVYPLYTYGNPDRVTYRIIRDMGETAIATIIRDEKILKLLEKNFDEEPIYID